MGTILIVEDEDQVRVLSESVIQEMGHKTLSASTAELALALLEGVEPIDLIFTDIGLQSDIQAGLTIAQEALKRKPKVPVLYTTGQGLTDGMRALFIEDYGFLAKPYTADQLTTAVQNLLPKK
jgi:DNA-binding NtrC family response regulator